MAEYINRQSLKDRFLSYKKRPLSLFVRLLVILSAVLTIFILVVLIGYILIKGVPNLRWNMFELEYTTENVSMMPAIINTVIMTFLSLLISVPVGVFSAIYLAEYAKQSNKLVLLIRLTAETLSGIPSIVYGLFGFLCFAVSLKWGYSIIGGALTLSIMILPLIMRTTEEALLAVPDTYREGSYGLGAGKLRTIFKIVLPSAMPGILAGVILGTGRVVGETAALIYTSGTLDSLPESLKSPGSTLAVHMYKLLSEGLYTEQAYATAVVLIIIVVLINALSSFIAKKVGTR